MDKGKFVEKAPHYYALAIAHHILECLHRSSNPINHIITTSSIQANPLVRPGKLFDLAVRILIEDDLIKLETDDFGPVLFEPVVDFEEVLFQKWHDREQYRRYLKLGFQGGGWLDEALRNLLEWEELLRVTDEDYENPDKDWSPIPVETSQPEVQAVIGAVDDAVEKIRASNGYAATRAEERQYVLDALMMFRKRFQDGGTIAIPYIRKYAIEPLGRAIKTLGQSAAGLAAEVVKAKIKEWLMKQGIPWPHDWTW